MLKYRVVFPCIQDSSSAWLIARLDWSRLTLFIIIRVMPWCISWRGPWPVRVGSPSRAVGMWRRRPGISGVRSSSSLGLDSTGDSKVSAVRCRARPVLCRCGHVHPSSSRTGKSGLIAVALSISLFFLTKEQVNTFLYGSVVNPNHYALCTPPSSPRVVLAPMTDAMR